MSEEQANISVTFKGAQQNDPWIVVRGNGKDEVADLIEQARDLFGIVAQAGAEYLALGNAATLTQPQAQGTRPRASGYEPGEVVATSSASPESAPPAQAAPQNVQLLNNGQTGEVPDKWGNVWVYNLPEAPSSPRGPMVKGIKKKRDGTGTYAKWYDPAKSGLWYPRPKPAAHELVEDQWVN